MARTNIEQVAIGDLVPWARNARTHSKKQVRQIADSIRTFGFTNPVLLRSDGTILAGHGRVMAAELLDLGEVPTITLGHLTDAQARAYIIADNKLALNAGWDYQMLATEIERLESEGFETELLGFDEEELRLIVEEPDEDTEGLEKGSEEGNTGADTFWLKISEKKIPMTQDEHDMMFRAISEYVDEAGTEHGFANWLLEKAKRK